MIWGIREAEIKLFISHRSEPRFDILAFHMLQLSLVLHTLAKYSPLFPSLLDPIHPTYDLLTTFCELRTPHLLGGCVLPRIAPSF